MVAREAEVSLTERPSNEITEKDFQNCVYGSCAIELKINVNSISATQEHEK